jgi:xylan 1,4-beta-xylosidase
MSLVLRVSTNLTLWATRLLVAQQALAQTPGIRTYCDPIDIEYKYNFEQLNGGISYCSGADPVIVNHKGEYYLFVTVSDGYFLK